MGPQDTTGSCTICLTIRTNSDHSFLSNLNLSPQHEGKTRSRRQTTLPLEPQASRGNHVNKQTKKQLAPHDQTTLRPFATRPHTWRLRKGTHHGRGYQQQLLHTACTSRVTPRKKITSTAVVAPAASFSNFTNASPLVAKTIHHQPKTILYPHNKKALSPTQHYRRRAIYVCDPHGGTSDFRRA